MTQMMSSARAYPFAVERTATGYSAGALQFASIAAAGTREELLTRISEQVSLHLLDCEFEGRTPEAPQTREEVDLRDYVEVGSVPEVVYAEPAPVSVVSLAIERAIHEEGLTYAEVARRMGTTRSVLTRITNPFYFNHSSRTLRKVARALGREIYVSLDKAGTHPSPAAKPSMPSV